MTELTNLTRHREPGAVRVLALHLTRTSTSEAKVLATLLENLDPDVHVDLVFNARARDDPSTHFANVERLPRVSVHWVPVGLPPYPAEHGALWRRLLARMTHIPRRVKVFRFARSLRPDVIYTSQQRFDCRLGELLARWLRLPHLLHLHYTPGPWLRTSTMERLRTVDEVIAISRFIGDEAVRAGVDPARITVVPNALAVSPSAPAHRSAREGVVTIGQTGRMDPDKGFADSLSAFVGVHRQHSDTRLVLVGDGAERALVESAVREHGLSEVVTLTGWRSDVPSLLDEIDVFVHPSRREPFGLAVLEAMAAGIPVVAYRDGALAELVIDGRTGRLVRVGDVDELTGALLALVASEAKRTAMGTAGRQRVAQEFHPSRAGQRFSLVIRSAARREPVESGRR